MTITVERPQLELQPDPRGAELLPILTVDMDGVFCSPFFGWNVGISSTLLDPDAEPRPASIPPTWLRVPWDTLRFNPRRPLPDARTALARLSQVRRLVVLTGRRTYPSWWLRRHGLVQYFDRIMVNETPLRSPHYKLEAIDLLGAAEHVDDDPRTAQLLAQRSRARVFLRTWPTNADTELDPRVARIRDLHELADALGAPRP
ncbi:MAG: HAD family hydrolase [Dehalococcoidia bacterium]